MIAVRQLQDKSEQYQRQLELTEEQAAQQLAEVNGEFRALEARSISIYHLSQNYYITAPYFGTINFGRRNVKITSQKWSWNYFWAP